MKRPTTREAGVALLITLLLMFIFTMMTLGFYYMVTGEQKIAVSDRDNTVAFYGAQAGLEKMSADLAAWFVNHASPTPAQIDALTASSYRPSIPGITFPTTPNGYVIVYQTNPDGSLRSSTQTIGGTGPLVGLQGIVTPLTLTVISQGRNGTEVKFTRQVQEVAVPVFQFGIFSDNDLSFFAGPNFNFGGRAHTNGYLYLAEGGGILTVADKATAYREVIRTQLSNGWPNSTGYTGTVDVVTTPGNTRALAMTEGSLVGGPGSARNTNWPNLSLNTYAGSIRTKLTGARKLNLALALGGGTPIDMIRRAPAGESPTSTIGSERFFNQASLRILLSDTPQSNITGLPGIDTTKLPYPLDETQIQRGPGPFPLPPVGACNPPLAQSRGNAADPNYWSPLGTSMLAGRTTSYIKIEIQLNATPGTWQDVTQEILSLGVSKDVGTGCAANKSIIHFEELRPGLIPSVSNNPATDYVPINLYDPREGELRDTNQASVALAGVMNLIEIDVGNLQKWFAGTLDPSAPSGSLALNSSGYILYTSDRRSNYNSGGVPPGETGDYGWDDIINPADVNGIPNNTLDPAEDVHQLPYPPFNPPTFNTYGKAPQKSFTEEPSWTLWFTNLASSNPSVTRVSPTVAQRNGVLYFRRALRLVNGQLGNLPPLAHANCSTPTAGGFTVASENPIYVLGDYNADPVIGFTDSPAACHVPAAVIGDAVTLLSDNYQQYVPGTGWWDVGSFTDTLNCTPIPNRCATTTYYRTAIVSGKNYSFTQPTWPGVARDFGTDGGAHNFLRYIENWGGQTLNYRGAIVSFYISRQATGIYKCCTVVYSPPSRGYNFDTDFSNIGLLPPGTPRFSDVNALSFTQAVLPTQ